MGIKEITGLSRTIILLVITEYQAKHSAINRICKTRIVTNGFHSFNASSDIDDANLYN